MSVALKEELEAVEAILMEGIEVVDGSNNITTVLIQLHPLTASDDDKKYVSMTLEMVFPGEYPDKEPKIKIRNPRGLDDASLDVLLSDLAAKTLEYLGSPVIFELVELCREYLTESNVPACPCAICLHAIVDEDVFHRTSCYHYFHSYCLGRYARSAVDEHRENLRTNPPVPGSSVRRLVITCPVCREPLEDVKTEAWLRSPPPRMEVEEEGQANDVFTPELLQLQKRMKALYLKQKMKGSIIDVEAEDKKFLVTTVQQNGGGEAESPADADGVPQQSSYSAASANPTVRVEHHRNGLEGEVDEEDGRGGGGGGGRGDEETTGGGEESRGGTTCTRARTTPRGTPNAKEEEGEEAQREEVTENSSKRLTFSDDNSRVM